MNVKRWLLGSLGVYIAYMILDWIIHSWILMGTYEATASVWRPVEEMHMWVSWITIAVFALLFVYIFLKGSEGKGILEGVRFGLWMGLLINIPMAYGLWSVLPIPYSLAFWWWVLGTVQIIVCGIVAAWLYKPAAAGQ